MATETIRIVVTETGTRRVVQSIDGIGRSARRAGSDMDFLRSAIRAIAGAVALRELARLSDTFTQIENRLGLVTSSSEELVAVQRELLSAANDTRSSFEATAELYTRVALSARNLGVTQREVISFTKALNQAIILSGATAQEARNGVIQFAQGLAANRLAGDELRATLEQLPLVSEIIARELGVTRGALRELAAQGKITATEILAAFGPETQAELEAAFAKTIPTISQSFVVLQNELIFFLGELNRSTGIFQSVSEGILFVARNFRRFAEGVLGALVIPAVIRVISLMRTLAIVAATNPLGAIAVAASFLVGTLVALRDEITLTEDSFVTLEDVAVGLGEEYKIAFSGAISATLEFLTGIKQAGADTNLSLQDILTSTAIFADRFVGVFVGLGRVLTFAFRNPLQTLRAGFVVAINGIVEVLEFLSDSITSVALGIGRTFRTLNTRLASGAIQIRNAITQISSGNFEAADEALREATFQITQGTKELASTAVRNIKDEFAELRQVDVLQRIEGPLLDDAQETGTKLRDALFSGLEDTTGVQDLLGRALERAQDRAEGRLFQQAQAAQGNPLDDPAGAGGPDGREDLAAVALRERIELLQREQQVIREGLGLTGLQREARQQLLELEEQLRRKNVELTDAQRAELLATVEQTQALQLQTEILERLNGGAERARVEIELLTQLFEQGKVSAGVFNRELNNLRLEELANEFSVEAGFERGFLQLENQISDFASQAEQTLTNAFSGAEDALVSFVTTGQVNFSSLVDSILGDLTRLLARQGLFALLNAFGGSFGGGFGAVGGLGGFLFGGERAEGGPVRPDQGFVVGERGPELFVPPSSGTIVPTDQLGGGGSPVNISVVNVSDPNEVSSALNSSQGQDQVVNIIGRRRNDVLRVLGIGGR